MLRSLKIIKCIFNGNNFVVSKNGNKVNHCMQDICLSHRMISFDTNYTNCFDVEEVKKPKKKTPIIAKITLINTDGNTSVIFLEDAQKLAKRRNLQLELISEYDNKSNRSVYRLVNYKDYKDVEADSEISDKNKKTHKFESKQNHKLCKSTKLYTIRAKIANHDINVKINNINRTLKKHHKVKVHLSHPNGGQEAVLQAIKSKVQGTISTEKFEEAFTVIVFSPLKEIKSDVSQNDNNS